MKIYSYTLVSLIGEINGYPRLGGNNFPFPVFTEKGELLNLFTICEGIEVKEWNDKSLPSPNTFVTWAACSKCGRDYPMGVEGNGGSWEYCPCGGILDETTEFVSYYIVSKETAFLHKERQDLMYYEKGRLHLPY